MPTIKLKRNAVSGTSPTTGQLVAGELALNIEDAYLYAENNAGTAVNRIGTTSDRVKYLASGTGAVPTTVQAKLRESVSVLDFGATTTDLVGSENVAAINAAIASLPDGGTIVFPAGVFVINAQITLGKNIRYVGMAKTSLVTKGTVLHYTGSDDAFVDLCPINSSTASNIYIENLNFYYVNQTAAQKKSLLWLRAGSFIKIVNCTFSNAEYAVILDQAEHVEIQTCNFESFGTGGVWITNGADKSPGADQLYTNRINISANCQFNSASARAIIDDGGVSHSFAGNNFNAGSAHIRVAGVLGLYIGKNEFEVPTSTCISFTTTTFAGTALTTPKSYGVFVGDGNFFLLTASNIAPIRLELASVDSIEIGINTFSSINTSLVSGESSATHLFYSGLSTQRGIGTAAPLYNNPYQHFSSSNGNSGTFTMSGVSAITINNNKVTATTVVIFTPVNAGAAQAEGSAAKLYAAALVPGVSFQPSTGNASAVTGTYNYFMFN